MKLLRRLTLLALLLAGAATPARLAAQPPQEQQGEFVPAESLPQRERMPAAPLLIAAYAFVMVVLFVYMLSVARRLAAVKTDLARLENEIKRGSGA